VTQRVWLYTADSVEFLKTTPNCWVDAVVCDPPYGLRFMGKEWDDAGDGPAQQEWHRRWAVEAFRILKPGGHIVAFGGSRTYHRLVCALEDAGFEIRDSLMWIYLNGFPKSLNVGGGRGTALKPGYEIAVHGVKVQHDAAVIESCLSKLHAIFAEQFSASSHQGFAVAFASALQLAAQRFATQGGLSVATGTLQYESATNLSLSTVSSWRELWAAHSKQSNTFTTETASSTTIDLKILSFCLSRLMQVITTGAPASELQSLVAHVVSLFAVVRSNCWHTQMHAVTERATWSLPVDLQTRDSNEPCVLARKPLDGTVAANVAKWGTGALNIAASKIATSDNLNGGAYSGGSRPSAMLGADGEAGGTGSMFEAGGGRLAPEDFKQPAGRWPANVIVGEDAAPEFTKYFYCPKVSRAERDMGCEHLASKTALETVERDPESAGAKNPRAGAGRGAGAPTQECAKCGKNVDGGRAVQPCSAGGEHEIVAGEPRPGAKNHHPTVKPVALMRWLIRLVTPPGGIVLDPFMGSGSTGVAAMLEGMRFVGIDREAEYAEIAHARIIAWERFK
jgi:DNA modification methylase